MRFRFLRTCEPSGNWGAHWEAAPQPRLQVHHVVRNPSEVLLIRFPAGFRGRGRWEEELPNGQTDAADSPHTDHYHKLDHLVLLSHVGVRWPKETIMGILVTLGNLEFKIWWGSQLDTFRIVSTITKGGDYAGLRAN